MHVLVVETSGAAREHVRAALEPRCEVRFAGGMGEALAAMAEQRPDVVVSEIDLGDGDGLALCRHIRQQPELHQTPILLLTSRASIADKVAGFQAGADDYVVKPLEPRLFRARLQLLGRIKSIDAPTTSDT
jgi:DNA-binding response OmpR family regulator